MTSESSLRQRPLGYGQWWKKGANDLAWYEQIFDDRWPAHNAFLAWVSDVERVNQRPIESVLEIGCGRGVVYPGVFRDKRYVGFDISEKEIAWCNENRASDKHEFVAGDFIEWEPPERFDLVFSHAVIDHVYDMDAFLRQMVRASKGWIYCVAYRGWNPRLEQHAYNWNESDTCYYNDLSPRAALRALESAQVFDMRVYPLSSENEIDFETVLTAATTSDQHHPPVPAGVLRLLARTLERADELEVQISRLSRDIEKQSAKVDLISRDIHRVKELVKRIPLLRRWLPR